MVISAICIGIGTGMFLAFRSVTHFIDLYRSKKDYEKRYEDNYKYLERLRQIDRVYKAVMERAEKIEQKDILKKCISEQLKKEKAKAEKIEPGKNRIDRTNKVLELE